MRDGKAGEHSLFRAETSGIPPERLWSLPQAAEVGRLWVRCNCSDLFAIREVAAKLWLLQLFLRA